mgnify:FL=1|jgi:septal ring factor EnvC (AmiA/AmiB activator)
MTEKQNEQMRKWISWAMKGLSASVLPLIYWLNEISVDNAVLENQVINIQNKINQIEYQVYEVKKDVVNDKVMDARTEQALKDIEKDINSIEKNLNEIQKILIEK